MKSWTSKNQRSGEITGSRTSEERKNENEIKTGPKDVKLWENTQRWDQGSWETRMASNVLWISDIIRISVAQMRNNAPFNATWSSMFHTQIQMPCNAMSVVHCQQASLPSLILSTRLHMMYAKYVCKSHTNMVKLSLLYRGACDAGQACLLVVHDDYIWDPLNDWPSNFARKVCLFAAHQWSSLDSLYEEVYQSRSYFASIFDTFMARIQGSTGDHANAIHELVWLLLSRKKQERHDFFAPIFTRESVLQTHLLVQGLSLNSEAPSEAPLPKHPQMCQRPGTERLFECKESLTSRSLCDPGRKNRLPPSQFQVRAKRNFASLSILKSFTTLNSRERNLPQVKDDVESMSFSGKCAKSQMICEATGWQLPSL